MEGKKSQLWMGFPVFALYELSGMELKVLLHILRRAGFGVGECWESQESMALVLEMSRPTLRKAFAGLEKKKFVTIRKRFAGCPVISMGERMDHKGWDVVTAADERGKIRVHLENREEMEKKNVISPDSSNWKDPFQREEKPEAPIGKNLSIYWKEFFNIRTTTQEPQRRSDLLLLRKRSPDRVSGGVISETDPKGSPSLESESGSEIPPLLIPEVISPESQISPQSSFKPLPGVIPHPDPSKAPRAAKWRYEESDMTMAREWAEFAIEEIPTIKINFDQWANEVRLIRQSFGITVESLRLVLKFVRQDCFWRPNAVSILGLRKPGKNGLRKYENIVKAFRATDSRHRDDCQMREMERDGTFDEWDRAKERYLAKQAQTRGFT